jgi:hypothetical protein
MRFNTPEEVLAWAEKVAAEDIRRYRENNIELNPFCTQGAREDWRRGFKNLGPRSYEGPRDFDTIYQRGRAVARQFEQEIARANELGFDIVKDTESDYYMFKARNWVEDSPATFDIPADAAKAVIDLYGN